MPEFRRNRISHREVQASPAALRKGFVHFAAALQLWSIFFLVEGAHGVTVHPQCRPAKPGGSIAAAHVEDVTALLHGTVLPPSVCVFNPSVTHLQEDLYLWSARAYAPANKSFDCVADYRAVRPLLTHDKWVNLNSLVLVVTRLLWTEDGSFKHDLIASAKFDVPLEDGRLFRDAQGALWILMHSPRGAFMTVSPITASCGAESASRLLAQGPQPKIAADGVQNGALQSAAAAIGGQPLLTRATSFKRRLHVSAEANDRVASEHRARRAAVAGSAAAAYSCRLELGGTQILWYTEAIQVEKNWVPHHGTTRMSYPVYPSFTPHSVFDWGSYDVPAVKTAFDSVSAPEPFFLAMNATYGRLLEFSGSTPALLEDSGGSYLAVGHLRAHGQCFHGDPDSATVTATCSELAKRTMGVRPKNQYFSLRHQGREHAHHFKEYAMFLYRFASTPPYTITHISHAFTPCSLEHHSGIVYPAGLSRIGPQPHPHFLIAYGEANRYSRLMILSVATVEALLVPIEHFRGAVQEYSLCTVPCTGELR